MPQKNLIAGITVGVNTDVPINIDNWNHVIIVDKKYFLKHKEDIEKWARENQ